VDNETRRAVARILRQSVHLSEAERAFKTFAKHLQRPTQWGLFDGYKGRDMTTAGLTPGNTQQIDEYMAGYDLGRCMAGEAKRNTTPNG
jgi:hypothetical protein